MTLIACCNRGHCCILRPGFVISCLGYQGKEWDCLTVPHRAVAGTVWARVALEGPGELLSARNLPPTTLCAPQGPHLWNEVRESIESTIRSHTRKTPGPQLWANLDTRSPRTWGAKIVATPIGWPAYQELLEPFKCVVILLILLREKLRLTKACSLLRCYG